MICGPGSPKRFLNTILFVSRWIFSGGEKNTYVALVFVILVGKILSPNGMALYRKKVCLVITTVFLQALDFDRRQNIVKLDEMILIRHSHYNH